MDDGGHRAADGWREDESTRLVDVFGGHRGQWDTYTTDEGTRALVVVGELGYPAAMRDRSAATVFRAWERQHHEQPPSNSRAWRWWRRPLAVEAANTRPDPVFPAPLVLVRQGDARTGNPYAPAAHARSRRRRAANARAPACAVRPWRRRHADAARLSRFACSWNIRAGRASLRAHRRRHDDASTGARA